MKQAGYIGLGIMGAAMARNLLHKGFKVVVWNRTQAKAQALLDEGAVWAGSPAELADQVDVLYVNVTDTPDVEAVLFGQNGVATRTSTTSLVVVDHSTISPDATRDFAARLKKHGIEFLDAPVTGGDIGARDATLSIMVGGDEAVFKSCLPMLEAVGKRITHVGPNGAGQLCKACNQIMGALNLLGVCEALALAQKGGLALDKMLSVTGAGAAGSWALDNLGKQIAAGDMQPGFMIDLIRKDLAIVQKEAAGLELPLLGTPMVERLFQAASEMGHGKAGTQALSRVVEAMGNFKFNENSV